MRGWFHVLIQPKWGYGELIKFKQVTPTSLAQSVWNIKFLGWFDLSCVQMSRKKVNLIFKLLLGSRIIKNKSDMPADISKRKIGWLKTWDTQLPGSNGVKFQIFWLVCVVQYLNDQKKSKKYPLTWNGFKMIKNVFRNDPFYWYLLAMLACPICFWWFWIQVKALKSIELFSCSFGHRRSQINQGIQYFTHFEQGR